MLGANLRQLSQQAASISALCRDLGINRTQYNRYLAGESFPRPDVLHKICSYFGVDARILLEPVEVVTSAPPPAGILNPVVADYLGAATDPIQEEALPSGFYRFTRRSFTEESAFVRGIVYIFRNEGGTFLKGFEAKEAMRAQNLPTTQPRREFRGVVLPQEDGYAAWVSRKGFTSATFNYFARIPTFENNFWVGYAARTVREGIAGERVQRMVYEFLGSDMPSVLPAARSAGFCSAEDLLPYHRTLLKLGTPFS